MNNSNINIIIPAFNEEASISKVLNDLPQQCISGVIVVDNGSTDSTAKKAAENGAIVVTEPRRGYGRACLTGIEMAKSMDPDIIVFLDGDYSDYPEQIEDVLQPIFEKKADLVIGSRTQGDAKKGALLPQARFGNWLASLLIKIFWGYTYTDLGPFRAITWEALISLKMQDTNFGWTVEMQIKALMRGLQVIEVPVSYRKRIGVSKVTGTLKGTFGAGYKILWTIFKYGFFKNT
ncbi:MAG: glycosyltransferase [Calditrichaeota bacterium]|nr:MAG: glycosyltransferase [Calditrichota bacterium]